VDLRSLAVGGRSDVEKDFCFLPWRPGERGRVRDGDSDGWVLSVEREAPGRRVAREFCSVIGKSLCGVWVFGEGVACRNEAGTALPEESNTVFSHDVGPLFGHDEGPCAGAEEMVQSLALCQLTCSVVELTSEAS